MNQSRKMIHALAMLVVLTCMSNIVRADDGVEHLNSANQALLDGNFAEALAGYQLAEQAMPASHLLAYNKGVAFYQQGQIEQASQSFAQALDTDDPDLAAQAAFNLGNCQYATALEQIETEPASAIESLRIAIANYRTALQINPADTDSRVNIELARQLMQRLEQDQQQQDQQQQDQATTGSTTERKSGLTKSGFAKSGLKRIRTGAK